MLWNFHTIGNSRGQRMVDPIIMYQNYGTPTQVVNLKDKQIVFPEDDDSDIIIVNEDNNMNTIEEGRAESVKQDIGDLVETTTQERFQAPDINDYIWKTTEWSSCNAPCGQDGHQIRGAMCQHKLATTDNQTTTVETNECLSRGLTPPVVIKNCASEVCASWRTGAWSAPRCLPSGTAIVRRRVQCVANNGTVLPEAACVYSDQPEKTKKEAQPCKAVWVVGPWSKCKGPCGHGLQHRVLRCVWRARTARARARERAAAACTRARPPVVRECYGNCVTEGVCRDTSRYCVNVRAMNMCALRRYKEQCCKTCED